MSIQSCEYNIVPRPRKWELKNANTDPSKVQITREKNLHIKCPVFKVQYYAYWCKIMYCILWYKKNPTIYDVKYPFVYYKNSIIYDVKYPFVYYKNPMPHCLLCVTFDERLDVVSIFTFELLVWPFVAICGHLWPFVALFSSLCGPLWPFEAFAGLTTWPECQQDQRDANLTKGREN